MFTGIIEETGRVASLEKASSSGRLEIMAELVTTDVQLGDSIAVNGVCLTVTSFSSTRFAVDVMAETLARSTLGELKPGDLVNLERALRLSDRLGGHLVQGHVDGTGILTAEQRVGIARVITIGASSDVLKYVVPKGSIAIDGISLTVVELMNDSFSVSLIPHTAALTTLGSKKPGDRVNLESDIIGRYVERLLNPSLIEAPGGSPKIDAAFLAENGFI